MTSGWRSTRFMRDLEVRLVEGQNSAAVDLFDSAMPRKCWRRLAGPSASSRESRRHEQGPKAVLEQAVSGLAQEGKVIWCGWPCLPR